MKPLLLALALVQTPGPAPTTAPAAPSPAPAAVAAPSYPWTVGETLTYTAKLGLLSLGSGTLEVAGLDTVRGMESFPLARRV